MGLSPAPPPSMTPPAAPPQGPPQMSLAGASMLQEPTPESIAREVKTEVDAIKQFITGFAASYPQAEKASQKALKAVQEMADSVVATLEPPLGSQVPAPPQF